VPRRGRRRRSPTGTWRGPRRRLHARRGFLGDELHLLLQPAADDRVVAIQAKASASRTMTSSLTKDSTSPSSSSFVAAAASALEVLRQACDARLADDDLRRCSGRRRRSQPGVRARTVRAEQQEVDERFAQQVLRHRQSARGTGAQRTAFSRARYPPAAACHGHVLRRPVEPHHAEIDGLGKAQAAPAIASMTAMSVTTTRLRARSWMCTLGRIEPLPASNRLQRTGPSSTTARFGRAVTVEG